MAIFYMKRGDRRPYLPAQFFQPDGTTPLPLTGAQFVYMIMSVKGAGSEQAPVFRKACVITNAANGLVEYRWEIGDTATPGDYNYEFEIVWNAATEDVQTIPVQGYLDLVINDDLDTP